MNTYYLMSHISTLLQTQILQYSHEGVFMKGVYPDSFKDMSQTNQAKVRDFLLTISPDGTPLLAYDNNFLNYAVVTTPSFLFLLGPVHLNEHVSLLHCAPDFGFNQSSVPICEFQRFIQQILLLRNMFYEIPLSEDELKSHNLDAIAEQGVKRHFSDLRFQSQEVGNMHNPYDQEIRELSSIRNGDVEQLKQSWSEQINGEYGVLAKDHLRSVKNTCIVVITLASRAAIDGGVTPEIAFSLSDSYIYKIEELNDPQTIHRLCRNAEIDYTRMVQDINKQRLGKQSTYSKNPRIEQCKNYIFKHLHEKIHIRDIAHHLKTNANYLAGLFSESEGITIRDYIMQEKMNLARHLLMYSRYTFTEIATSLGFCSQSHFGKNFKAITHLTPRQYRETYGVKDLLQ